MDILEFVVKEGYIVIVVLWIIGKMIKDTNVINNKWTPWVLLGVSLILTPFTLGGFTADNINQSVVIAGLAVFGHQLVKQTRKDV